MMELDLGGQIICLPSGSTQAKVDFQRTSNLAGWTRVSVSATVRHWLASAPKKCCLCMYMVVESEYNSELGCQSMTLTVGDFYMLHFHSCCTFSHQMWNLFSSCINLCWAYELFWPIECNISDCVLTSATEP